MLEKLAPAAKFSEAELLTILAAPVVDSVSEGVAVFIPLMLPKPVVIAIEVDPVNIPVD